MKYLLGSLLLLALQGRAQTTEPTVGEDKISTASGNPYLFKDWMDGVVYFKSGRVVKQFKLKLDCARNRLMMQFEGNAFAAESQVKEFVIYTSKKNKDSLLFRKGFPAIDKNTADTYYQVMLSGKAVLLRLYSRILVEEKQMISSNSTNRLEEEEAFYLYQNGVLLSLPRNKEQLLEKLPVQSDQLKTFVTQQSLRMDRADDFLRIISKYNELIP